MKKNKTTIILMLFFFIGLAILIYPTVSNYTNKKLQSKAIVDYEEILKDIKKEDYDKYFKEAVDYNKRLSELRYPFVDHDQVDGYNDILNVDGNGMIGYLLIPKINVELSIFHGTSLHTLNSSVGHLEGSSLPTGEIGTHVVLSAHTGLPSAKLFTNIDKLEKGDIFTIKIYDRSFSYEVDQIKIVKPNELDDLKVEKDKDFVTLTTCTPYGLNTHRLLVRGYRTLNVKESTFINTEAFKVDKVIVCSVVTLPLLLIWIVMIIFEPTNKYVDYESIFVYPNKKKGRLK